MVLLWQTVATGLSCGPNPPQAFSCEALQRRAEACEEAILDIVRRRYEAERITAGAEAKDAHNLFIGFKQRFQRNLRKRVLLKDCHGVSHPRVREQHRRFSAMRYCFFRPTCEAFGECLLTL